jgi:hypothetical protein
MERNLSRHQDSQRGALGLEVRLGDVPQVLAVRLQGRGPVAHDANLVRIVDVEDVRRAVLTAAGEEPPGDLG